MSSSRHRFVIVGAGLAGAATAFHLRRAGVTDVLILEQEAVPGAHASGRNAAIVREHMEAPALRSLARESAAVLRRGQLAEFRSTGGLLLGAGETDARDLVPVARGRGRHVPTDGVIDVAALLQSYLAGCTVRYGTRVQHFETVGDVVRIETDMGILEADVLVLAAGPWAGALGRLPFAPRNRHLFVSAYDADVRPDWPFLWDLERSYYLRPESGGWLLCACDEADGIPGQYDQDPEVLEELCRTLRKEQPGLGDLKIARQWVGQRTFAADDLPAIGFDPRWPQVFHVAALGGHGVTLSWSLGRLAARALLGTAAVPSALAAERCAARTTDSASS